MTTVVTDPGGWNALPVSPPELVRSAYARMAARLPEVRRVVGRPLTLAEKVLYAHARVLDGVLERGVDYGGFDPDRIAMPDSGAQMVLLQLMSTGEYRVGMPATIHCDHLVAAERGAGPDLAAAEQEHGEVYDFLIAAAARVGVGVWKPGSGIIHQVLLENYAFPGGLLFATDSHTPNAGGLGMVAVGVGGADGVDAMVGDPVSLKMPRLIGVRLVGTLGPWCAPKDVILEVAKLLTVKGGTGAIVEYFGPGAESISATGKATICNMGAEIGATTSLFNYDEAMGRYLRVTGRGETADLADAFRAELRSDPEVHADPASFYDRVLEIDLSALSPQLSGPGSPDLVRPFTTFVSSGEAAQFPAELSYAMIGSCTNSSYEDIGRAADVARQAREAGLTAKVPLFVSPGSASVQATMERDGILAELIAIGATVLSNACGPCIGQWNRTDGKVGERNTIITSFNRNFPRRNDGSSDTLNFIASPEIVVAAAITGRLDVDPTTVPLPDGRILTPPQADELPQRGWIRTSEGFIPPPNGTSPAVVIDPTSTRLQALEPFAPVPASDYTDLQILLKAQGKCTTDHISPAGPWLRYRGHLERLAENTLSGALDAFTGQTGHGRDLLDGQIRPLHETARRARDAQVRWLIIGDTNYGEGSSREHAAMQVRYLGGTVVITRSFARIHESNLKKQGVLPLTFADPNDYDTINADDRITVPAPATLTPGQPATITITRPDGTTHHITTHHTLNDVQIAWLTAGSAMNHLRNTTN